MHDLFVLTPSRGRPENMRRLLGAFSSPRAHLVAVIDLDDPEYLHYQELSQDLSILFAPPGPPGIVRPLNWALGALLQRYRVPYIGFMGDDHLPRTLDWADRVIEGLEGLKTGIIYGNDLVMGEDLPTAAFMTVDIPQKLGYMAPPELQHLYVDNYWYDLGQGCGRITYRPDIVIEHLHPAAGKGVPWDGTYAAANDPNIERDRVAYSNFVAKGKLARDIKRIQEIL